MLSLPRRYSIRVTLSYCHAFITGFRSISQLQAHITALEKEYNMLSEELAKGEHEKVLSDTPLPQIVAMLPAARAKLLYAHPLSSPSIFKLPREA